MSKVTIENLGKRFGVDPRSTPALQDVNLTIGDNEFVTLVGASGCGKSTLLRILAGLETHTAGRVVCACHAIEGPGADRAMVFQHYSLYPWLSVIDNIKFSRKLQVNRENLSSADVEAASGRADALLDLIGLSKVASAYPNQLSGGMQQRVAIARAIVTEPAVLLADEPTGNLDTQRSREIMELLWRLNVDHGITVLMVTHEADMAAYARRIVRFVDGVVANDTLNPSPAGLHDAPPVTASMTPPATEVH